MVLARTSGSETAYMNPNLVLHVGMRVVVNTNVRVDLGIGNGTLATVGGFVWKKSQRDGPSSWCPRETLDSGPGREPPGGANQDTVLCRDCSDWSRVQETAWDLNLDSRDCLQGRFPLQ